MPFGWLTTDCTVNPPMAGSARTSARASTSRAGDRSRWNLGSSKSYAATTSAARVLAGTALLTVSGLTVPLDPGIDELLHVGARGSRHLEHIPVDRQLHAARAGATDPVADRIDDLAQHPGRLAELDQQPAQRQQLDALGPFRGLAGRDRLHLVHIELRELVAERQGTLRYRLVIVRCIARGHDLQMDDIRRHDATSRPPRTRCYFQVP